MYLISYDDDCDDDDFRLVFMYCQFDCGVHGSYSLNDLCIQFGLFSMPTGFYIVHLGMSAIVEGVYYIVGCACLCMSKLQGTQS